MDWLDVIKSIIYGIIEGVTEWLPISSTGHLILLERLLPFKAGETAVSNAKFFSFFLIVIQLGAILAVVVTFWRELWPFPRKRLAVPAKSRDDFVPFRLGQTPFVVDKRILRLWWIILIACVPAAIIGLLFDEQIEAIFYNPWTVAIMLIVVGVAFYVVEHGLKKTKKIPRIVSIEQIDWRIALIIGLFQVVAAVFPGTSRSGATILGGLMIGMSRPVATTFTFYLAVPVMFGASLLKLLKIGLDYNLIQWLSIFVGMGVAYLVSILVIRFLLNYIRKRDFRIFAYYRVALGCIVLIAAIAGFFKTPV
ncbi:MAG TPA: undecaprenyl-diphosphate phosphatase [Clostridiaceae bacterium]|nr:undecaprenyl-diphosphate phosphatase [Clostridiaceae bacterium]